MSSPPQSFDMGTLLAHLACEFARLADTAEEVQLAAADVLLHGRTERRAGFMIQLQALDSLSQVLRDLQRLAGAAAASPVGAGAADPGFVRQAVQLQSLAERLISGPDHDDGHDHAAFLL